MIIRGNVLCVNMQRTDYAENDPTKGSFLLNKPTQEIQNAQDVANAAKTAAENHIKDKGNPHGVTANQSGAVTEQIVSTMISEALGVIENGTY